VGLGLALGDHGAWLVAAVVGEVVSWGGKSGGLLPLKALKWALAALRLPLEGDKGVPQKQGAGLGMFELQLCQLYEVLAEGGDTAGLEIHELLLG